MAEIGVKGPGKRSCRTMLTAGLLAGLVATTAVSAAQPERRHETSFEVTPFIGQMVGGGFEDPVDSSDRDVENGTDWGLFLNLNADSPERQYELFYAQQGTEVEGVNPFDLDIRYLQIGGIVNFTDTRPVVPYFGMTIGATQFSPDASDLDDETRFSLTFGGGLKYMFTDHIGLRFDARAFVTLVDTDSDIFCVSTPETGGTCRIRAASATFVQYAAGLGIVAAF